MSSRTTKAYIDTVENGVARVQVGKRDFVIPLALLPRGSAEGDWISISIEGIAPPPGRSGELQRHLGEGDDGSDIKL